MRIALAILSLVLASGAGAQTAPDCAGVTAALGSLPGFTLTIPPSGSVDGWCVLDGARWRSKEPGLPNLSADQLRLRQKSGDDLSGIEVEATGLRVSPRVGDAVIDDRLRALFRLQSADLRLDAVRNEAGDRLDLRGLVLRLSGGTELTLEADMKGAGLAPASLAAGAVTRLDLRWRSDGRLAAPVMELAGESLVGVGGTAAVDAARAALAAAVAALPAKALSDDSRAALAALVADLPQGRGKLQLTLSSEGGISAARIALAAFSGDPFGPKALAALFSDARIDAVWVPGLAP